MQMGGGADVKPGMGVGMGGGAGPNVGIGAGFGGNMMGPQGGNMNMGMTGPGGPSGVQDMGGMGMGMMGMGMPMGGDMGMQDVVDGGPGNMGMEFGSSGPGIGGPMAIAMGGEFMGVGFEVAYVDSLATDASSLGPSHDGWWWWYTIWRSRWHGTQSRSRWWTRPRP